jgi:hypothetical protein
MRTLIVACVFLFALAALWPEICQGQVKCPWINEATARGILGGPVTMKVEVDDQGAGVCKFSRQEGSAKLELRIAVHMMTDIPKEFPSYLAECPPKSAALRAIGNEAIVCSAQGKSGEFIERVAGRVRKQAFVIGVSSSVEEDPAMTKEMRREKANVVAEHVAGILF